MVVVTFDSDVLVPEFINAHYRWFQLQSWKLKWLPLYLNLRLLHMIEIEVTVATGPNEITRIQPTYLGNHTCLLYTSDAADE